ncbi:MAG: MlaD family protein [Mangrovibacterium sp.]
MKISRNTKLGLLILFTFTVFVWGINYLKGIDFFRKNTSYNVLYPRVDGLVESSAVTINGYQVGQVRNIAFSGKPDGSLLVSFILEGDFRIPKGSVARIVSSDIMGTRSIKLELNPSDTYYRDNDTIPGAIEGDLKEQVSMQVLPLKNKAEQLLSSLDSAITVVTYVFNEKSRENITESFEHVNQTIFNLRESSEVLSQLMHSEQQNIREIMENLKQITDSLNRSSGSFVNIMDNVSVISDSLAGIELRQMFNKFSGAVTDFSGIIRKLNADEGTAGMLINDPELYNNLTNLSLSLEDLVNDLRNNPKRYVHFSAFDLGKEIYVTPKMPRQTEESKYNYRVNLVASPVRINADNPLFREFQPVEEVMISGLYNYMSGESSNFEEIYKLNEKAKKVFPDAAVVAFKNDRPVRLEKALKKSGKGK